MYFSRDRCSDLTSAAGSRTGQSPHLLSLLVHPHTYTEATLSRAAASSDWAWPSTKASCRTPPEGLWLKDSTWTWPTHSSCSWKLFLPSLPAQYQTCFMLSLFLPSPAFSSDIIPCTQNSQWILNKHKAPEVLIEREPSSQSWFLRQLLPAGFSLVYLMPWTVSKHPEPEEITVGQGDQSHAWPLLGQGRQVWTAGCRDRVV